MEINAALIGQSLMLFMLLVTSAVLIGLASYKLGRRKTQKPVVAGLLGFVLGFMPIFGIIYLLVLTLKDDAKPSLPAEHG